MNTKTVLENEPTPNKSSKSGFLGARDWIVLSWKRTKFQAKRAGSWIVLLWKRVRFQIKRAGVWITPFVVALIGLLLFYLGAHFQSNIFQGVGGFIIGAAVTLAVTIFTGKEAVKQQSATVANIERKNELYIHIFSNLKSIQDWWTRADKKASPYPLYIQVIGNEPQETIGRPLGYPIFNQWPYFKEGPRKSDFTGEATRLFDKVQEIGVNYNQAMQNAKEPVCLLLDPHVKAALLGWRTEQSFKDWYTASDNGLNTISSLPLHYWHEYIQKYTHQPELVNGQTEVWVWVYNTIGWMVVGNIEGANTQLIDNYSKIYNVRETPGAAWFREVLGKAWADIDTLPEIHQVRDLAKQLSLAVDEAKKRVDKGLHYIQKMYEGGEPPV